ncbi:hypothetical protein PVT01_000005500 [Plasmodium vivax]|uniref:VIR protein n=1 Tax=Plasmodium vivax TaxID=5855 RepID=A0A1G4EHV0_PLAVI|nr:hypothetical protein PVT01_000005500 [Plasmodium vivax]
MPCVKPKSKYEFCKNSPYYQEILEHVKKNESAVGNEENCDLSTTTMTFSDDSSAKKISINRCYGIYDEFYKALKDFKSSYNYTIVQGEEDTYNCRGNTQYKLNDYDPVLEREKTKIMLIQGSTSFLMLILTFPLIYKFTPFGPFLQGKIKKVKNMWKSPKKNKEKMLSSSMDIGNNISDNIKYKLAYNSVTNE